MSCGIPPNDGTFQIHCASVKRVEDTVEHDITKLNTGMVTVHNLAVDTMRLANQVLCQMHPAQPRQRSTVVTAAVIPILGSGGR